MDIHAWRRELDRLSEMKGMLATINPSTEQQTDRQVRQLYDVYAKLTGLDKDLSDTSGLSVLKKRKIAGQVEKASKNIKEDFMRVVRDFAEIFRKEQRDVAAMLPRIQYFKPAETKTLSSLSFPSIGAGDIDDFETLYKYGKTFSQHYVGLHQDFVREVKGKLDENKRTLETYERHISIDRGEVPTTSSIDEVANLPMTDLIPIMEKLKLDETYLDGRKDEVSKMLSVSLITEVESLQTSVETSSRLGLDLPMDFTKQLRVIARDSSKANNLTALISLENQLDAARLKMSNMLRDRIINMKHEVTAKIVEGGIPTTSDVIPLPPDVVPEADNIASLLSAYQKMVEWSGQVKLSLKDRVADALNDVEKATDFPDDAGIKDIISVRKFVADSKKELKHAEIDGMIKIHLKAKSMVDEYNRNITDQIRSYITRFNELATSADKVLDYAQLSKKAPKVEELEGGTVFLLESLANLRKAVESGVGTFRDAAGQEIDAIISDLQTIKPAYAEIFMPIISELDEAKSRMSVMEEFGEIRSEMRSTKEAILAKAKDALENLRYRLGVKIRLAAAKLMGAGVEIPKEAQEAISELNSVSIAADTVFSLPAIARKMVELYEHKITAKVIEALDAETVELKTSFGRAEVIGVDLKKELKVLDTIISKPPQELEDAAEYFDRIRALTTSTKVHDKIKNRANESYEQLKSAITLFEDQGMPETVERLKTLLEKVPEQLSAESQHVNEALDVCLTLATIQDEMLSIVQGISRKDGEKHLENLKKKSKYYSTITRVYESQPAKFSKIIYPLEELQKAEKNLEESETLDEAIKHFSEIDELREGWVEKATKMNEWHKSMKMFMAGFSPAASLDDRNKFIDDAIRKIRETYSREDISSYLGWALKEIAETMVSKRG
ncbi:MAG: hypothetical protein E3J82_04140 [Candidatus Thorarchaeota archaeon]|nr:MAG: hypothetical protein E3J82_04140 [Candidatus Thorarchaeota archaeon]